MHGSFNNPASSRLPVSSTQALTEIRSQVTQCRRCLRLVEYREEIARNKKKEFNDWVYWGRPVPGFGDPHAELLIVGLAPAAHGGNRTGRVFTGDRSGDFLYKALHRVGLANQARSESTNDGLRLDGAYVTAAVKCAPPDNKPTPQETLTCSNYLAEEISALRNLRAILCLGQFAFNSVLRVVRTKYNLNSRGAKFGHAAIAEFGQGIPTIFCSFHPSPRNTQTGKLTEQMFLTLLRKIQKRISVN
jgi:uracil-DNA glycosylase